MLCPSNTGIEIIILWRGCLLFSTYFGIKVCTQKGHNESPAFYRDISLNIQISVQMKQGTRRTYHSHGASCLALCLFPVEMLFTLVQMWRAVEEADNTLNQEFRARIWNIPWILWQELSDITVQVVCKHRHEDVTLFFFWHVVNQMQPNDRPCPLDTDLTAFECVCTCSSGHWTVF